MKKLFGIVLVLLSGLALTPVAEAGSLLTLTIDPDTQAALPGQELTFTGTLSGVDAGSGTVFINGDRFETSPGFSFLAPDPALLNEDDTDFVIAAPLTMSADGLSGPNSFGPSDLFTIGIGSAVTPGTYIGTFDIVGGTDGGAQDTIGSADFTVTVVQSAPEPASILLFAAGLAGLAGKKPITTIGK